MSYNTDLQSNNEELAEILRTVNELPEADNGEFAEPVIEALEITANGTYTAPDGVDGYSPVNVEVSATLQSKTVSPSISSQTVKPDNGYDGLSQVIVNAMPSGTAGTPTATKGSVSNHTIIVTPEVTNTTGHITGGTKTGTGVTVSASELVSGTLSISENGIHDVKNYASVDVNVAGSSGGNSEILDSILDGTVTNISNDTVQNIRTYAFYNVRSLIEVSFSAVTEIGSRSFSGCTGLTKVNMPRVTSMDTHAFYGCTNLKIADFAALRTITYYDFQNCSALEALILRGNSVCTLDADDIFKNSGIANGTGYIYVPSNLVTSYRSATNWAAYASQIRAIEDYPEITGG